jgi:hypothetical protein
MLSQLLKISAVWAFHKPKVISGPAAANLIDLPKLPESRRDKFASSAERCFIGATVRETVGFDVLLRIYMSYLLCM